ncbi:MAG TPA: hypothetical protein VJY39_13685 [Acidisphaera sp.]|nr:hypothetical protein [Acidisphaera sp.]
MNDPTELPEPGYPISQVAVAEWFRHRYGREASIEEIGRIIIAMTDRDTTAPSHAPAPSETGWTAVLPEADPGQERER